MTTGDHPTSEAPHAASADRVLDFHPGMKMRWEITRSTADTGGALLETVNSLTLIKTGKIKRLPPKDPRSVTYAAMLFAKYTDEQHVTQPPHVVFKTLALLGRALGLKLGEGRDPDGVTIPDS
jgi:hypothetical protein